jgi:isopentenyldiphosphate isomerase
MDELIDVRDDRGERTGETVLKSEAHRLGLWHRCFHCWVLGADENEGPYMLVQRRAAVKDTWPGYLDVTAGGHLAAGEETFDGLRELEEELGLRAEPGRLVPLGTLRSEIEIPAGTDREFFDVFLLIDDTPPEALRLQREEVEAVIRIRLDEMETLFEAGSAPAREYPAGGPFDTRVTSEDFVPHMDDYIRSVTQASRRLLTGEPPGRPFHGDQP